MKICELNEAKIITDLGFKIWISPTKIELRILLKKYHEMRGIVTSLNIYFWDANESTHRDVWVIVNDYEGEKFVDDVSIYVSDTENISSPTWVPYLKKYGKNLYMTGKGIPYAYSLNRRFKLFFPEDKSYRGI